MKSLLISLMAFLCVLGVNATPSGTGTKEDPYVIADGDCTSLNLVYFKESFPYGVPCFLLMQKTSFHVAKGHVLQRESMPFALQKDVFCVAGLMLLPEPLWRHGHDNTIRHTIQRFFRQTGVSFCGLSARRARCA